MHIVVCIAMVTCAGNSLECRSLQVMSDSPFNEMVYILYIPVLTHHWLSGLKNFIGSNIHLEPSTTFCILPCRDNIIMVKAFPLVSR